MRREKEAISREAVKLVQDGMSIGLSAGTTTWTLATHLRRFNQLTVVTNSIRVANVFYDADSLAAGRGNTVLLTGGERTPSDALVGPLARQSLQNLNLDLVFLGVHGVDSGAEFTTPNILEAEMDRALIGTTQRVIAVADHSKWGVRGVASIASFRQVEELIVDDGLSTEARSFLKDKVSRLRLARVS